MRKSDFIWSFWALLMWSRDTSFICSWFNQPLLSVDILWILQAETLFLARDYGTLEDVLLSSYGRKRKHAPGKENRNECHSCALFSNA